MIKRHICIRSKNNKTINVLFIDVSVLKHLHLNNKNVQRLWSLEKIMTGKKI
jgi:hypothetical protein